MVVPPVPFWIPDILKGFQCKFLLRGETCPIQPCIAFGKSIVGDGLHGVRQYQGISFTSDSFLGRYLSSASYIGPHLWCRRNMATIAPFLALGLFLLVINGYRSSPFGEGRFSFQWTDKGPYISQGNMSHSLDCGLSPSNCFELA